MYEVVINLQENLNKVLRIYLLISDATHQQIIDTVHKKEKWDWGQIFMITQFLILPLMFSHTTKVTIDDPHHNIVRHDRAQKPPTT